MKLSKKHIEIAAVCLLYLSALFVWSLPIQGNKYPFGDVDASSHFGNGDYMSSHDKSILNMPDYFVIRYYGQNEMFPAALWYPPQFWTNTGIMQSLAGSRLIPFFLAIAVFCTLFILSTFFLIRKLFGFWPAFLSGMLLIFSVRDFMVYLFGQWPQSIAFSFTPLAIYCYYKYTESVANNEKRQIYLYLMAIILVVQNFMHPIGFIASFGAIGIYTVAILIKERKIAFRVKDAMVAVFLFLAISTILAPFSIGEFFGEIAKSGATERQPMDVGVLLRWYPDFTKDRSIPESYFHYKTSHGDGSNLGYWTMPLLILGILALIVGAFSEKDYKKNMLMLSWLTAFYILTHLAAFGMGSRDSRMLAEEAHVFYPIIAIGLLSIPSMARLEGDAKRYAKAALIIVFVTLAILINGKYCYEILKQQQRSIDRINEYQYEASDWIMRNIPEGSFVYDIGTSGFEFYGSKVKWLSVLSQRPFVLSNELQNRTGYIMIDYSDMYLLGRKESINSLKQVETDNFGNSTPDYSNQLIKVYKVEVRQQ